MRKLVLLGALAATALIQQTQSSDAYFRGKWCALQDIGGGVVTERCDFPSLAICNRYVADMPKSHCNVNPYSAANWGIDEDRDGNRFNHRYR